MENHILCFFSVEAANAFKLNSVEKELGAAGECSPSSNFEIEMHKTNFLIKLKPLYRRSLVVLITALSMYVVLNVCECVEMHLF
jgi:hypothetical protein